MSRQSSSILHVCSVDTEVPTSGKIEFDEYVPLRWTIGRESEVVGAGYVRLGDFRTTLLEIAVAPNTQLIRGLTITSMTALASWPEFVVSEAASGLPRLATSFGGWEVIDLDKDFKVSVRAGEVLVYWGELGPCVAYSRDQVRFLVREGLLVGVWFVGLTSADTRLFTSHAGH